MALKNLKEERSKDRTECPRCGSDAIYIDGKTVRWLSCPNCKFKKLMDQKSDRPITVKPLIPKEFNV